MKLISRRFLQLGVLCALAFAAHTTRVEAQYPCPDFCLWQQADCTMGGGTWHVDCGTFSEGGDCNLDSYCHPLASE